MSEKKDIASQKTIKIIILGDGGVGKTSIFTRYIHNKFDPHNIATTGVDFESKIFKYKDKSFSIILYDTAGEERFRNITKNYYHMGDGIFIVFDLTNENSLISIKNWVQAVLEENVDSKFIILGNKDDLKDQISKEIIDEHLKDYKDRLYIKTSAKTNKNIKHAFEKMIDLINGEEDYNDNDGKKNSNKKNINSQRYNSFQLSTKNENKKINMSCC